jgi:hypothetical protein
MMSSARSGCRVCQRPIGTGLTSTVCQDIVRGGLTDTLPTAELVILPDFWETRLGHTTSSGKRSVAQCPKRSLRRGLRCSGIGTLATIDEGLRYFSKFDVEMEGGLAQDVECLIRAYPRNMSTLIGQFVRLITE